MPVASRAWYISRIITSWSCSPNSPCTLTSAMKSEIELGLAARRLAAAERGAVAAAEAITIPPNREGRCLRQVAAFPGSFS